MDIDSEQDDRFDVNGHSGKNYSDDEMNDNHSDNKSDSEQSSEVQLQLSEKEKLEYEVLELVKGSEKKNTYHQTIVRDLLGKLNDLNHAASTKTGEELINIRIQELALSKLLVLNYGKSDFRLVLAHYHLGQAYLGFECIEQAIEHLSLSLHKIEKLTPEVAKAELVQVNIMITLAQAFMAQPNFDDALDTLNKAEDHEQKYNQQMRNNHRDNRETARNVKILVLKAQCFSKQRHFQQALEVIDEVVAYTKKQTGKVEYAFALVDRANILAEMNTPEKYQKAIEDQQLAINILVEENYPKPQEVAELYSTLSTYFQKINNPENALTCIQKVKTLYEELYSPDDKRVIKARRKIATALLKSQRYKEAVTELLQISKLQEKVFGETLQLARTLKLLGTVYISLEIGDARVYLKRAMDIFHTLGNKKQVQQIKQKLKNLLSQNNAQIDINVISEQDI